MREAEKSAVMPLRIEACNSRKGGEVNTLSAAPTRNGRTAGDAAHARLRSALVGEQARPAPRTSSELAVATRALRRSLDPGVDVTVRSATSADAPALEQLAVLSSADPLQGELLVAEVEGELWAACAVSDGSTISDPFRPTRVARSLLDLRRKHLLAARHGHIYGAEVGLNPLRRWRLRKSLSA